MVQNGRIKMVGIIKVGIIIQYYTVYQGYTRYEGNDPRCVPYSDRWFKSI
jgi:hypothetical protein